MDKKNLGVLFQAMIPVPTDGLAGLMGETLPSMVDPDKIHVNVASSQTYLTRSGEFVDIFGCVDEASLEYSNGYRFYGSGPSFYKADGLYHPYGDSHAMDLVKSIAPQDRSEYRPIPFGQTWIHPLHRDANYFFKKFNSNTSHLEVGHFYLNRMGFVLEIQDIVQADESTSPSKAYVDQMGVTYDHFGRYGEGIYSMLDVDYEVLKWVQFKKSILATDFFAPQKVDDSPDLYDPEASTRQEMMDTFFKDLLKCNNLAKALGIDFGFHMLTKNT
jgi:hypothetical protein